MDQKTSKTLKESASALVPVASFILFVNTLVKTETSPCKSAFDAWIFWFCAIGFISALVKSLFLLLSLALAAAEADEPDPRWQKGKIVYYFRDADKDEVKDEPPEDEKVEGIGLSPAGDSGELALLRRSNLYQQYVVEGENDDGTYLLIRRPNDTDDVVFKVRKTKLLFPAPEQNPASNRCNTLLKFNQRYIVSVANLMLAVCLGSITFAVDSRTGELISQCDG